MRLNLGPQASSATAKLKDYVHMVIQEISRDAYIFLKILIDFSHLKDSKSFLKIFRDSETLLVT